MKIIIIYLISLSSSKITQINSTNELLPNKVSFLQNEIQGKFNNERQLTIDEIQEEIREDQTHNDVYDGMYSGLGKSPIDFKSNIYELKHEIEQFRKHSESDLLPEKILEVINYAYIINADLSEKLHHSQNLGSRRILEEEKYQDYKKWIEEAHQGKLLDMDYNQIYDISNEDLMEFQNLGEASIV